jgi:hypothetical protein
LYLPGTVSGQKKAAEKIFRLHTYRPCGYPYGYPQLAAPVWAVFKLPDKRVCTVIMLAMRLMSPWPGTGGNLNVAQQPCMREERQTLVTERGGETRHATA